MVKIRFCFDIFPMELIRLENDSIELLERTYKTAV